MFEFYPDFYKGKRVFVTGHTGFKGAWLCRILKNAGAVVTGYALNPPTDPSLFELSQGQAGMTSVIGDICDGDRLSAAFREARPEIVFHLAAQPLVRESYRAPARTYATNVMGTVGILECIRTSDTVRSFLNVTTDKVYENREWEWGYRENEPLCGFDPYSNSKSCSELVTASYKNAFFADGPVAISTARAGNVIGGGDFAADRIVPDCVRAVLAGKDIVIRNPDSVRPYQHVLEPLFAYLMIAARQYEDGRFAGCYNVGPDEGDCYTTGALAKLFTDTYGGASRTVIKPDGGPHEATYLKLDCSRLKKVFGWRPVWSLPEAVSRVVEFTRAYEKGDVTGVMDAQIADFLSAAR